MLKRIALTAPNLMSQVVQNTQRYFTRLVIRVRPNNSTSILMVTTADPKHDRFTELLHGHLVEEGFEAYCRHGSVDGNLRLRPLLSVSPKTEAPATQKDIEALAAAVNDAARDCWSKHCK
ncbi:MAG: hypothetical protein V4490_06500 [Pseudomonadota bacterium]